MWTRQQTAQMEMQERKDPKFMTFAEADFVEGVLVGIEPITVDGKRVIRFTVEDSEGELFAFLGSYQLTSKLRVSDLGHFVVIRCTGEDKNVARNGNAMKTFQVAVSKNKVAHAGLTITDADLPSGI